MRRLVTNGFRQAALLTIILLTSQAFAQRQVIISIPDRKLVLVEDGRAVKLYPVAVGAAESPSPNGEFKVITRIENPTYYKPGTVIEPGKENPLGTRWIGINLKGYGIHGTNQPASIGKAASHGCIRMNQSDLEELFVMLREGDEVHIRAERDEQLARIMLPEPPAFTPADEEGMDMRVGPDFVADEFAASN